MSAVDFSSDGATGSGQANTGSFGVNAPPGTTAAAAAPQDFTNTIMDNGWGTPGQPGNLAMPVAGAPPPRATAPPLAPNLMQQTIAGQGPYGIPGQNTSQTAISANVMFEGGGTVGDDQGVDGAQDSGLGEHLALALTSVDAALAYGRQQNGLPTGDDNQQQAAAMPMIPGNQSETPGPYKPQPKTAAAMPMIPGNQSETPGPYKPLPKTAAAMPMIPGNQSETPGPYKPQPKVADNEAGDGSDGQVIPDDEETA